MSQYVTAVYDIKDSDAFAERRKKIFENFFREEEGAVVVAASIGNEIGRLEKIEEYVQNTFSIEREVLLEILSSSDPDSISIFDSTDY